MIDPLTLQLFGKFPREAANPTRVVVHNLRELENFLTYNEGIKDCFISIFPLSGEIDKIFLDFDKKAGLCDGKTALSDTKRVYNHLIELDHQVVPIASGKKGIHLHDLLIPCEYPTEQEAKIALYLATIKILEDVFGPLEQGSEYDANGKQVYVYYALDEDRRILGVDPKIVGDVRRICRLPGTRRPPENNSWCTFLPSSFVNMSWLDIINWCKLPHHMNGIKPPTLSLEDLPKSDKRIEISPVSTDTLPTSAVGGSSAFLSGLLRPCLYQAIIHPSPRHDVRVAVVIDLLRDWSTSEIADMLRGLGWIDWSESTTHSQIESCRKYKSYSCTKLRQLGLCLVDVFEDCPLGSVQKAVVG